MKYCAIVPHIEGLWREGNLRNVAQHPMHVCGRMPQSLLRRFYSRCGNIEDGEVLVSPADKIVCQSGFAGADIDDRRVASGGTTLDQFQRHVKMRTVPAHRIRCFGTVNRFPMRPRIHDGSSAHFVRTAAISHIVSKAPVTFSYQGPILVSSRGAGHSGTPAYVQSDTPRGAGG